MSFFLSMEPRTLLMTDSRTNQLEDIAGTSLLQSRIESSNNDVAAQHVLEELSPNPEIYIYIYIIGDVVLTRRRRRAGRTSSWARDLPPFLKLIRYAHIASAPTYSAPLPVVNKWVHLVNPLPILPTPCVRKA